jgi:hypothetical protein
MCACLLYWKDVLIKGTAIELHVIIHLMQLPTYDVITGQ